MAPEHPILQVDSLKKFFNGRTAVAGIDLAIEAGTCFGLLGPNGAGKTTAVEMMENIQSSDGGRILFKGKERNNRISGGQRQRLLLGLALINDPDLLFLDEPTTGLDPQARQHVWDIIKGVRSRGKTIILTTHYMESVFLALTGKRLRE